ncbi:MULTISPECIES: FIMAH domain-containing protein [unclassified Micromonospora]|uniref:FIMAH domain-containing protein n=1 Tax=unclassified Micromonospora TaxID=2617518 RepID=UPI002FEFF6DF
MAGALVAVLLAAIVVTFTGGDPEPSAARPAFPAASGDVAPEASEPAMTEAPTESASASPSPTPSSRPRLRPAQLIAGLHTTITGLVRDGQLSSDAGEELTKRLREAEEKLAAGEGDKAREKLAEFGEKVVKLRKQDKLSAAGYQTLAAGLAQLAQVVPSR